MARRARIVVPGIPHHVTHRGNRKCPIFFEDADFRRYLELLAEYAARHSVRIWAYCLMINHVHLIAVPADELGLSQLIRVTHSSYARELNARHDWTGHLFANRFYSTALSDDHFWEAARYTELNPVRAGIVEVAEDYPWSSARAHVLGAPDALLSDDRPFGGSGSDWRDWLREGMNPGELERLRENTRTGRPTGDAAFIDAVAARVKRRLEVRPRGPLSRWQSLDAKLRGEGRS